MIVTRNVDSAIIHNLMTDILKKIHIEGPVSQDDFETLAYIKKFYPEEFSLYEKRLLFGMGLFYKTGSPNSIFELAYNTIKDAIIKNTNCNYTPVQAKEYKDIIAYKHYSFSAPTSTGKSFLFLNLIKNQNNDVVIVLPSRALIAEYLFNIQKSLSKDVLVLQFVDNINLRHTCRKVFIITPERSEDLFAYKDSLDIGLILFDEAQISEEDIRGLKFDALVRKTISTFPKAKKIFAHPFVANPNAQLQRNLISNDCGYALFEQNSVGKIYMIQKENGSFETFSPFSRKEVGFQCNDIVEEALNNGKTVLFYVSKNKLYSAEFERKYQKYINQCDNIENPNAIRIIENLHRYIGDSNNGDKQSRLVSLMKKGIVIHHGSMPLKIRLMIEEFVRLKCAKLCFATSTLIQGINMPFDVVYIDNFMFRGSDSKKILDLKNLIGRAGRTTGVQNRFDYGYVVIPSNHKVVFSERLNGKACLSPESKLNCDTTDVSEDNRDIVEAIKNNAFDYELRITQLQKSRIEQSNVFNTVSVVLSAMIKNNKIITSEEYYNIKDSDRKKLKENFAKLYTVHLRRQKLTTAEATVLSAAIPIMLWRVQGKSFKEILSLRLSFITQKSNKAKLKSLLKSGAITKDKYVAEYDKINLRRSPIAFSLPNEKVQTSWLFADKSKFDFDTLVYDTYDYIDKVIGQSLTEPICAVLKMYHKETGDIRAVILENSIRYGTNDETSIWLMRYGFALDDMEWLVPCVAKVNEDEIIFNEKISELDDTQKKMIDRYIY